MRTKSFVLVAVALFAALVGGFLYVALGGGEDRRVGALLPSTAPVKYALELEGANVGFLKSVSGCGVSAPVLVGDKDVGKRPGEVKYTACQIRFGNAMTPAFYQWINDSLGAKLAPRNVAIIQTDFEFKIVNQFNLANAVLTRFGVPALDAASNAPVFFEATLKPATIQKVKGSGAVLAGVKTGTAKLLLPNIRLTIPGSDVTKVNKIEAWSYELEQFAVNLSDLTIQAAESGTAELQLLLDALIQGKAGEQTAKLELLDATLTNTLFELNFTGVGMIAGQLIPPSDEGGESVARRQFSFYVEGATVKFN